MNIEIIPSEENGKKKFKLKIDGKDDRNIPVPVGKTALRIRMSDLITQL